MPLGLCTGWSLHWECTPPPPHSTNTWAIWFKELTHWKRPWCWERLRAGEGGHRGWDGWMASLTQWMWAWANSRRQWRTGKPGVLQPMGCQSQMQLSNWQQHSTCWNSVRISRPFQTFIPTWHLYWSLPHVFLQFVCVHCECIFWLLMISSMSKRKMILCTSQGYGTNSLSCIEHSHISPQVLLRAKEYVPPYCFRIKFLWSCTLS